MGREALDGPLKGNPEESKKRSSTGEERLSVIILSIIDSLRLPLESPHRIICVAAHGRATHGAYLE